MDKKIIKFDDTKIEKHKFQGAAKVFKKTVNIEMM